MLVYLAVVVGLAVAFVAWVAIMEWDIEERDDE